MIERLERRALFALAVTEGFPGFYEVTGDGADDTVAIDIDQANNLFTMNGQVYGGASFVLVNVGAGNDTVHVVSFGVGFIGVSVIGEDGNDVITISGVGGAAWGGLGDDRIELTGSFRGEAYGEDGADHITLKGICTDAEVHGGAGNDTIVASESGVPLVLYGDAGMDRLYGSPFGDVLDGGLDRDLMFGNGGDDQLYARDGALDWVIGGEGNDTTVCDLDEMSTSGTEIVLRV